MLNDRYEMLVPASVASLCSLCWNVQVTVLTRCVCMPVQSIEHPRALAARGIVRMDVFWSMWRSRTIPCPHGSGRPACETVLLHHEQFKIPENLARFAVRHGMTGFVKKMGPAVEEFVADRRKRVTPVCACYCCLCCI